MTTYNFYYKKTVEAKSLKEATRIAEQTKPEFYSMETVKPEPVQQGACPIGFQYTPEQDEY